MSTYNATLFYIPRPPAPPINLPGSQVSVLPLNLIALIISHLDNVADLARVCQTSRVLHYMTLPQLYRNIKLTSYDVIRFKDDRAEGIGSASPFSMGLNALVTRSVSTLVRTLALQGQWREHDLKEYSQFGRVPDDAMMLNIAVRAAVDRWDLNTKLLPTVYQGLANLQQLETFYLRFPSSRSPRPTGEIPAMPNLRSFTMTDYDPLCFPDDISTLLLHATKLESLKMHFSPRMRDAGEPSVQFSYLFRKNVAAKRRLKLKTIGIYNLFAYNHTEEGGQALDPSLVENVTFINTFGEDDNSGQNGGAVGSDGFLSFLDHSWANPPPEISRLKSMRHDRLSKHHAKGLSQISGLEKLYLVNARHKPAFLSVGAPNGHQSTEPSPASATISNSPTSVTATVSNRSTTAPSTTLRDMYLEAICSTQGPTLRHLILPSRWPLPAFAIARLFRACPNLTQLAMSIESHSSIAALRMLVPFLKNLWAIRLLAPTDGNEIRKRDFECMIEDDTDQEEVISTELARGGDFPNLRFAGIGSRIYKIGGNYEENVMVENENGDMQMKTVIKTRITRITLQDVEDVDIWKMDSLDVV